MWLKECVVYSGGGEVYLWGAGAGAVASAESVRAEVEGCALGLILRFLRRGCWGSGDRRGYKEML